MLLIHIRLTGFTSLHWPMSSVSLSVNPSAKLPGSMAIKHCPYK